MPRALFCMYVCMYLYVCVCIVIIIVCLCVCHSSGEVDEGDC